MASPKSEKGAALIITLLLAVLLLAAAMFTADNSITEVDLLFNQMDSDKAFYIAQAGIEMGIAQLDSDADWRAGFVDKTFDDGKYTVILVDSTTQPALDDTLLLRSVGQQGDARRIVEVVLLQNSHHPLFDHAIYAGNSDEYDPDADSQKYTSTMTFGGSGAKSDKVTGDVFFNGNVGVTGGATINGNVTAGGSYTGTNPTGTKETKAEYLEPPDLYAQNYQSTADFYIGSSSPWTAKGYLPSADPRHIFVKDFRKDLATTKGYKFDNNNFFLGDPYQGANIDKIKVSDNGNKKTYFVDGNLWIEPEGTTSQLLKGPAGGTQITIIVKGNIYFSDNLLYNDKTKDGIAFIAMTDGESYTDKNGNSKYDSGEPILHDDGDGKYEGPSEGSGNVRFGDPNGGPLGDVNGFLYADNNFEDYVLDGTSKDPLDFSVTGTLSAGNQMNIRRDYKGKHAKMEVTYDERLKNGTLELPGLPKRNASGSGAWARVGWHEL
jgi:hypothetical protein